MNGKDKKEKEPFFIDEEKILTTAQKKRIISQLLKNRQPSERYKTNDSPNRAGFKFK